MNKFEFNDVGGYPIETDSFNELDIAYRIVNALGFTAGDKTILTGCNIVGNSVTDGVVFYDGEIFEFKGGVAIDTVKVFETARTKNFENGEVREVFFKRWIGFGTGQNVIDWAEFRRIKPLIDIQNSFVPEGMISMWAGAINEIPAGWKLCDGDNGTPDLTGRFIVGYKSNVIDYNEVGKTGGLDRVRLTEGEMPVHNHTGSATMPPHSHSIAGGAIKSGGGQSNALTNNNNIGHDTITQTAQSTSITGSVNINNKGGNESHENRPPYYTLAYIQFKGN